MLSTTTVSIVLLCIWASFYRVLKNRLGTSKLYFFLLLLMGSAGLFLHPIPLMDLDVRSIDFFHVVLFALLMLFVLIPWINADSFFKNKYIFEVRDGYLPTIRIIFIVTIICSFYAIVYSIPYAVLSFVIGSSDIRALLDDGGSLMPENYMTTMAMGFGAFSPVVIIFVFISLLNKKLRFYTPFLVISSTSYIVTTFASAARDGFVLTPLTYIVFFLLFKNSIPRSNLRKIKVYAIVLGVLIVAGMSTITLGRFYSGDSSKESKERLMLGTWGYFYQQPYVFNYRIDAQSFYGFKRRLSFLDGALGVKGSEYAKDDSSAHQMFGTMFIEFYEICGYTSLFIGSVVYVLLFNTIIKLHKKRRKVFPFLLAFCVYFYFTISGMFYFRYGGNLSEFFFYMGILLSSFFVPDILKVSKNNSNYTVSY